MKTQITKQHTKIFAVQPLTTFHKEESYEKQSFNTLKLAIVFAMVVTMTLSAVAQIHHITPGDYDGDGKTRLSGVAAEQWHLVRPRQLAPYLLESAVRHGWRHPGPGRLRRGWEDRLCSVPAE